MSNRLNNKRGSITILLLLFLSTFLLVIIVFTEAAAVKAARTYSDGVLDLAGRSILSEYDRNLKDDYGIFGMITDKDTVEQKMRYYAKESFRRNNGVMNFFHMSVNEIKADLSPYALTNLDLLEEQIIDYMKFRITIEGLNALALLDKLPVLNRWSENQTYNKNNEELIKREPRNLKNKKVIKRLPSYELRDNREEFKLLSNLDGLSNISGNGLCLNLYLLKKFRHQLDPPEWQDTFFVNEVEYILFGNFNDESNYKQTKMILTALRTGINTAHIYSDTVKRKAIITAATLLTPGPEAAATQIALAGAWATAEAINDVKRLEKGGKVPLVKTEDDWVIGLDHVLEEIIEPAIEDPGHEKGLSYENYLFLLLCMTGREKKLVGIMDLIQLNMKGNYYEDFLMSRCYGGVDYQCILERKNSCILPPGMRFGQFRASHVY